MTTFPRGDRVPRLRAYPIAGSLVLDRGEPEPLVLFDPARQAGRPAPDPETAVAQAAAAAASALDQRPTDRHRPAGRPHPGTAPRLNWSWRSRTRIYALCGQPIAVRFAAPELESLVHPRFGHSAAPHAEPTATLTLARTRTGFALLEAGQPALHARRPEAMLGLFVRRFVELSHRRSDWTAVLHAAAVGDATGRALLLPGGNGRGKSTLVVALLAAGYRYLSDDCAPLDRDLRVVPVPFGVCLKPGSWEIAARHLPATASAPVFPGAAGQPCRYLPAPGPAPSPMPPSLIVFPRFEAAVRPGLRRLAPVETLQRLVAGRAWLSRRPEDLRATLALIERLPAYALDYGALADAVALIGGLAAAPRDPRPAPAA